VLHGGEANRPAKTGQRMVATASTRTSRQLLFYSNETAKKSPGRTGGPYRLRAAIGRPVVVPVTVAAVVIAAAAAEAAAVDVAGAGLCGGGGRDGHRDDGSVRRVWWGDGGGGGPGVRWPHSSARSEALFRAPPPAPHSVQRHNAGQRHGIGV